MTEIVWEKDPLEVRQVGQALTQRPGADLRGSGVGDVDRGGPVLEEPPDVHVVVAALAGAVVVGGLVLNLRRVLYSFIRFM